MCSVGPQDYQSHHAAVRQGQDLARSHSHLHGDGTQGHIFRSHSPMSWSEAEGQDESWTCSRGGEGNKDSPRGRHMRLLWCEGFCSAVREGGVGKVNCTV